MKKLLVSGCLVAVTSVTHAQRSSEDAAAWYGIMITPVGAFPSLNSPASARTQWALSASQWKLPVIGDGQNSYALTYPPRATANVRYDATVGWHQPGGDAGSGDGAILIGAAAAGSLRRNASTDSGGNTVDVEWKLSVGFGHSSGNGGSEYWSVVGQLPLRWRYQSTSGSTLSAFVSPGYGVAGVGDFADAEQGLRPLLSFGGGWTSGGGFGVHLGTQVVMGDVEDVAPPWVTGISISIRSAASVRCA